MGRIAAHFLCMDESDFTFDYNDESYSSKPVEYYNNEVEKFRNATQYLIDNINVGMSETEIQTVVYDAARVYDEKDIRGYFKRLYQFLFSASDGPRLPAFIAILGVDEFKNTIWNNALEL